MEMIYNFYQYILNEGIVPPLLVIIAMIILCMFMICLGNHWDEERYKDIEKKNKESHQRVCKEGEICQEGIENFYRVSTSQIKQLYEKLWLDFEDMIKGEKYKNLRNLNCDKLINKILFDDECKEIKTIIFNFMDSLKKYNESIQNEDNSNYLNFGKLEEIEKEACSISQKTVEALKHSCNIEKLKLNIPTDFNYNNGLKIFIACYMYQNQGILRYFKKEGHHIKYYLMSDNFSEQKFSEVIYLKILYFYGLLSIIERKNNPYYTILQTNIIFCTADDCQGIKHYVEVDLEFFKERTKIHHAIKEWEWYTS